MTLDELHSLTLFPATAAQRIESRRRSFKEWGRSMSEEEYLLRDATMDHLEHAANGKLINWVLCPRDDPTTLDFKCSCETYQREGLALMKNESGWDREIQEVTCYGIASVFTPERFRKRGYAKHMMRLLHWALAPREFLPAPPEGWTLPNIPACMTPGYFSTLWSDVGTFYETCGPTPVQEGWKVKGANSTIWNVKEIAAALSESKDLFAPTWNWMTESDIPALWEAERVPLKKSLIRASSEEAASYDAIFSFLPGNSVESFQRVRLVHVLKRLNLSLDRCGVSLGNNILATWTIEEKPVLTLLVTRLRVSNPADFTHLLALLVAVAQQYSLERIETWNLPANLREAVSEFPAIDEIRHEHLPAIKWYRGEQSVFWANNERFAWC